MSKKITRIEPEAALPTSPEDFCGRKEKVAAYARVSTDHEEQATSLMAQTDYYKKKILANPSWEFAGIYADDGVSGTSAHLRESFNRMMQDCRDGKITMILTKSISRFARNTVDSIKYIRELRSLGIGVMFEKENIWSLDSKGEFLLTVMSSLAQEESRNISENVTWGHRKRMSDGRYSVAFGRFLGYDQGKDGEFIINQQQAVYVRRIFSLFLQGYSSDAIAGIMEDEGVPSPAGNENWHDTTIRYMISNETYKGDKLLQKTYTEDFLTKKIKVNNGELPQYYVKGGHEAIIEPELFDYVQKLVKKRNELGSHFSGQNPFSCKMICGSCGDFYGIRPWHSVEHVWECRERGRTGHTCDNIAIYDYALWYQLTQILLNVLRLRKDVVKTLIDLIGWHLPDGERRRKVLDYLKALKHAEPDTMEFGEEPAYIIQEITVFPENRIEVLFLDGQITYYEMRRYSPKLGWREAALPRPAKTEKKTPPPQDDPDIERLEKEAQRLVALESQGVVTRDKKIIIDSMRRKGASYQQIAKALALNVNTVKSYCRRHPVNTSDTAPEEDQLQKFTNQIVFRPCRNCGREVLQVPGRKEKSFCSDECRIRWWGTHQYMANTENMIEHECLCCGKKFKAYSGKGRKYCSHECYIKARFKG